MAEKLILLFILIPLLEFYVLIKLGGVIGVLPTILIILIAGILGGIIARAQGLKVIRQVTADLDEGVFPAESLWDGLFVLIGAALLIIPGIITDVLGLICIIPFTRVPVKRLVKLYISKKMRRDGVIDIKWKGDS